MKRTALELVKKAVEDGSKVVLSKRDASKKRGHLGASQIGHRCARQAWYGFRWFYRGQFTARMLRLFNRGHEEEIRIIRWLRAAGYEVRDHTKRLCYYDGRDDSPRYMLVEWDDPIPAYYFEVSDDPAHIALALAEGVELEQWGFTDGHFSGSNDGKIRGPHLPEGWGSVEFKTMNDKSFKDVTAKGVLSSKPVYWVQSQIYMRKLGLSWCLFIAANKNDDDLYFEVMYLKEETADQYIALAHQITQSQQAPVRMTEDPSHFECKFCDFREICHYDKPPQKNCRTCQYSVATDDGKFYCNLHRGEIPFDFQNQGCDQWLHH